MTKCLCVTLVYSLPHVLVSIVLVSVVAPVEALGDLFLQGIDAWQIPNKIELSSNAYPFYPQAHRFVVPDTPFLEPCMRCLMYDSGCDPFERRGFRSDDPLVE